MTPRKNKVYAGMSARSRLGPAKGQGTQTGGAPYRRPPEVTEKKSIPLRGPVLPQPDDSTGLPFDSDAPSRRRPAIRLSDTIGKILSGYNLGVIHGRPTAAMLGAWPEIAGPELTARLKIDKFENGILYVLASSNAELYEIRAYHLRALEAKLKKHPAFASMRQLRVHCE